MFNTQHLRINMFFIIVNTAVMALLPVGLQIFMFERQASVEDVLTIAYFFMSCFVGVTTGLLFGSNVNKYIDRTDKYTIDKRSTDENFSPVHIRATSKRLGQAHTRKQKARQTNA